MAFQKKVWGPMKVRPLLATLGAALAFGGCTSSGPPMSAPDASPIHRRSFAPTDRDGAVTVNCAVGEDRRFTDCRVVNERPDGKRYGEMALAIANKPEARFSGTVPPEGRVEFTIRIRDR